MTKNSLIKIINVPKIKDDGFLCFVQHPDQIPFDIKRVYYITSPVPGLPRGKHAHKKTRQILFCLSGKVKMILDNGKRKKQTTLTSPEDGIIIEPGIWHEMHDMSGETVLLVLASKKYDPNDYIRSYDDFLKAYAKK
jgi:dTDP-4-dehydrorhamnose 3,5-epimerase-like enzyme